MPSDGNQPKGTLGGLLLTATQESARRSGILRAPELRGHPHRTESIPNSTIDNKLLIINRITVTVADLIVVNAVAHCKFHSRR